jgi:hypothetical protein
MTVIITIILRFGSLTRDSIFTEAMIDSHPNADAGSNCASSESSGTCSYHYATSATCYSADPRDNKSATCRSDCATCNRTEYCAAPCTDPSA